MKDKAPYAQLEKYYQEQLSNQKNENHRIQNDKVLSNTYYLLNHFQCLLMRQRSAVQQCQSFKEKYQIAWKKQRAKRRHLRYLKKREWEREEEEDQKRQTC